MVKNTMPLTCHGYILCHYIVVIMKFFKGIHKRQIPVQGDTPKSRREITLKQEGNLLKAGGKPPKSIFFTVQYSDTAVSNLSIQQTRYPEDLCSY